MKISKFIGKALYDSKGQDIWAIDEKGNLQKIIDLRGWGAIQNLFKDRYSSYEVNFDKAAAFQDALGLYIQEAINEKIEREKQLK